MSRIGFIGLGAMGWPMAHLLHERGHTLVVRDADPARSAGFVEAHPGTTAVGDSIGGPIGEGIEEDTRSDASRDAHAGAHFAGCDTVITMLPDSDVVDRVAQALIPHLGPGACLMDMSSSDPTRTRALGALAAARGIGFIDAPVSGGVKKARAGTLAIMVGGDAAVFEAQRPLLERLGQSITHVGPLGAGHALKALNNYVSAAALIATAEAIHAGAAFGLERTVIVDVINASTGRNNTTENKARQFMLNGAFDSGFSLALQAKDVGIAAALGAAVGQPMALADQVSRMTREASLELGRQADHTELYRFIGESAQRTPG